MRSLILVAFALAGGPASAQTFECRMGQTAACLDWGETVCSSQGMCVSKDAACFDSYQCDYNGFACKSDVEECVEAHDELARDYNSLLSDFETLSAAGKQMAEAYEELQARQKSLQFEVLDLETSRNEILTCLELATTLEAAKLCQY